MSENQDLRAKIRWDCRRGMLELDFIFEQFIKYGLDKLTTDELQDFQIFLDNQDPDLFAWFLGYQTPEKEHDKVWVNRVLASQQPE